MCSPQRRILTRKAVGGLCSIPTGLIIRLRATMLSRMSAVGQKPTPFTAPFYDCFAPESGHLSAWDVEEDFMSTRPSATPLFRR